MTVQDSGGQRLGKARAVSGPPAALLRAVCLGAGQVARRQAWQVVQSQHPGIERLERFGVALPKAAAVGKMEEDLAPERNCGAQGVSSGDRLQKQ